MADIGLLQKPKYVALISGSRSSALDPQGYDAGKTRCCQFEGQCAPPFGAVHEVISMCAGKKNDLSRIVLTR